MQVDDILAARAQKADDHVTPETVHTLEYDARRELGSFLRETGRVSFQKLDHIRLYYAEAFGKPVNSLFDTTCDGLIFALAAFRNALTHNAGKADKQFVKRVQRFPEFREIAPGDVLPINGALVKRLTTAGAQLAVNLILLIEGLLRTAAPQIEEQ